MNTTVLAMSGFEILRVRGCLTGAVRVAYKPAEIQAVIVRNFSPALPRLMQSDNVVEALTTGISQQVRFFYSTPAESG
jgi:hypothetical protein